MMGIQRVHGMLQSIYILLLSVKRHQGLSLLLCERVCVALPRAVYDPHSVTVLHST